MTDDEQLRIWKIHTILEDEGGYLVSLCKKLHEDADMWNVTVELVVKENTPGEEGLQVIVRKPVGLAWTDDGKVRK